jgi:hypothetical protein
MFGAAKQSEIFSCVPVYSPHFIYFIGISKPVLRIPFLLNTIFVTKIAKIDYGPTYVSWYRPLNYNIDSSGTLVKRESDLASPNSLLIRSQSDFVGFILLCRAGVWSYPRALRLPEQRRAAIRLNRCVRCVRSQQSVCSWHCSQRDVS